MNIIFTMLWAMALVMPLPSIATDTDCELVILLKNGAFLSAASVREGEDGWIFLELDQGGTLGLPATEILDVRYRCCRIVAQASPRAGPSTLRRAVETAGETDEFQDRRQATVRTSEPPGPSARPDGSVADGVFPGRFRDSIPWWQPRARRPRRDPYLDRPRNDRLDALRQDIPWWQPRPRFPKQDPYLERDRRSPS